MTGASPATRPRIGVLALQGDVREHMRVLREVGADPAEVKRPDELAGLSGLVLPGGESSTMAHLALTSGLLEPLRDVVRSGLPVYGSCAGLILLADRILDGRPGQQTIGGIDMTVRRNAFGRQVDSFETELEFEGLTGGVVHAVFIRAPWVEEVGESVRVLATAPPEGPDHADRIVGVQQGNLLATSFHPELTGDVRVHAYFVDMVKGQA